MHGIYIKSKSASRSRSNRASQSVASLRHCGSRFLREKWVCGLVIEWAVRKCCARCHVFGVQRETLGWVWLDRRELSLSLLVMIPDFNICISFQLPSSLITMAQYLDRIQFFHDTYQPITPGSGTQYHGSTASELVAYTSSISPHIYTQGNKADSTREHKVFLVHQWPNLKVRNALRSIREVVLTPGWSPDTLMKVLPDVDEAFFDGLLRYRIEVAWLDTASVDFFGYTSFNAVENTCCIRLNRRTICFGPLGPRQQMFATLIHEMVVSINSTVPIMVY